MTEALREKLRDHIIPSLETTGVTLGEGSYGKVDKMLMKGEAVAVKKIHQILLGDGVQGTRLEQFEEECIRLSSLSHPNIVKFLGIYYECNSNVPTLVMEYIPICLKNYVESNSVPKDTQTSIMLDIAEGLRYIHDLSPPVVHRDLTSNNVLLTDTLQAKITDLGVSKLLDTSTFHKLTMVPGNQSHMPPEAILQDEQFYMQNTEKALKLDIFSFGNVLINILTGEFPIPTSNRDNANRRKTEVQRRRHLLDKIADSKEKDLIVKCLNRDPMSRPKAIDMINILKGEDIEDDQTMDDSEITFVDQPSYDVKCPICFEVFKDPHQVTCCGNHICKDCLDQNKLVGCPLCRENPFNAVLDKFFDRQLLCMTVECYNNVKGCPWTGELRMLNDHVEKSCSKNIIACKHCASEFTRNAFKEHPQECDKIPQPCPCNCSPVSIERRFLKYHLDSECPFRVINDAPVPRVANSKQRKIPLTLAMTNYSQFVQTGNTWYSSPFYTHKSGYKLLLRVDVKTNHQLSVLVYILKGEHDHKLLWPLRANIEVALYNWRTKTTVFKRILYLKGDFFCTRNTSDLPPSWGNGFADYIHRDNLSLDLAKNTNYIRHDCLIFCVEKMTLFKALPVPVFPKWAEGRVFAVPGFTLMKNKTPSLISFCCPPIHTGKDGYKVCVQANPWEKHASVHCFLMKGENDLKLPWPLEADVTVEMLNWKEDKNHMKHTFCFDSRCKPEQISKVLIDGFAPQGQSFNIAALSSLPQNLSKNTQYLNQDCLLFRVNAVTAYVDKKSFSKLPGWVDPVKGSQYPCFTLPEFEKRKNQGNCWSSHSFFTHQYGYKMQLEIRASRNKKVSLFLYLMKGPHDDRLQWPFSGDIVLELVNWQSDSSHHRKTIYLNSNVSNTTCERVIGRERGADGRGYFDFISHDLLLQSSATVTYLKNDCLHFRVKEVIVHSVPAAVRPPPWFSEGFPNCQFIVTNFTKRKEFNSTYYSPAFYSHSGGYKMMVKIDPNSKSHISVMVRILKGENDANLKWPFCGNIVIELTNFVRNGDHIEHNINLHERIKKAYAGRVGDTENQYWGRLEATSHAALQYNKSRNTEFLRYDCICVRVKRVASYSHHNLIVPRWQNPRAAASFTVTNIPDRIAMKSTYFSSPYLVDKYKMCLKITFDGYKPSERAKYLSCYACLLKGDDDDALMWPFCGDLTIEILNWHNDHGHFKGILPFDYPDNYTHARVLNEQIVPSGYGKKYFAPIATLFSQFLNENCMRIRVSRSDVYSNPLSLKRTCLQASMQSKYLFEFTINSVSARIRNQSMIHSAPFYTHENGYKMRLEVYVGGDGNNCRGYLSIYARLLAGENDSTLKWPMNVALKIEVLNWLSNSYHIMENITMGKVTDKSRAEVAPGTASAENAFGIFKFCSHATLYKKDRNVLYVDEDCIRVRVNNALIFSQNKKFFK